MQQRLRVKNDAQAPMKSGFSLIEVLVALLVLGIGFMGFIAMQLGSVETTSVTYSRTQAMIVVRDMIERININPQAWPLGYDESGNKWIGHLTAPKSCIGLDAACDSAEIAAMDVYEVRTVVQSMLFNGKVVVEARCRDQEVACVKVAWGETTLDACHPDHVSLKGPWENADCVILEFLPQRAVRSAENQL